jgi:hypothetical protein
MPLASGWGWATKVLGKNLLEVRKNFEGREGIYIMHGFAWSLGWDWSP